MVHELLAFELADELYAVPIGKVREILGGAPQLTRIPNTPSVLKGVINLRGTVLPVVDVREELGLPAPPYDKLTVVIVSEVMGTLVGLVVSRVVDVLSLGPAEIAAPPPGLATHVRAEFVHGLSRRDDRLLVILDLDRILTDEEMGILERAGAA